MKKIILFCLLFTLCHIATGQQKKYTTRQILDSLEVLKRVGGIVLEPEPDPTAEAARYNKIKLLLPALPPSELRKLMKDKDKLSRVYGFSTLANHYFDSLKPVDLEIFKDKTNVPAYTSEGVLDIDMSLGEMCRNFYLAKEEKVKMEPKRKDAEAAVMKFIKGNAKFPDSYKPSGFTEYTWLFNDSTLQFEIKHKYTLKQKDGKEIAASHNFVLEQDFTVNIIEAVRSKYNNVRIPRRTGEWLKKFGK
jgi:hypothetical protein